jgi:membrane dipeptidase
MATNPPHRPKQLRWDDLGTPAAHPGAHQGAHPGAHQGAPPAAADGQRVTVAGYPVLFPGQARTARFLLTQEPGCCLGCAPRAPTGSITVEARSAVALRAGPLRLSGVWRLHPGTDSVYRLTDATPLDPPGWAGVTRRTALAAGPLMCLAAAVTPRQARAAVDLGTTVDLHSHAGGIANVDRMRSGEAFAPVAEPMRAGGMAAVCLAVVSDGPTHKVLSDGRLHPFRAPDPGELYTYSQLAFGRLHEMVQAQGLTLITKAADLRAARAGTASAIIAAEGGDFLEGQTDRVDEAYRKWSLRHLQLTHYRVNELGDIQTELPLHGGLTETGAAVIRRCNRLGIVVDVAHGTYDLVARAVTVTTKPLVLSHTSLTSRHTAFTRLVLPEHARLVAQTGGVVGVWPPASIFPTLDSMAAGMARMVDAVGIDHVGLGSDMRGLLGPSVLPNYDRLPALAAALLAAGFSEPDVAKLLGGNYLRVFEACMV